MDIKEARLIGVDTEAHWYYLAKGDAICKLLHGLRVEEILDVGAGSGVFARRLLKQGISRSAVCLDPGYERTFTEKYGDGQINFVREVSKVEQRLVIMIDVLEHVENDIDFLSRYVAMMPEGGYVLVVVPAFNFLWSGHDVFLEHKRRYDLPQLICTVSSSGLKVIEKSYYFGTLFPLVACVRLINRVMMSTGYKKPRSMMRSHSGWVSRGLARLHKLECNLLFPHNKLFGLSVFCLARKTVD